jgi:hypothetical protein
MSQWKAWNYEEKILLKKYKNDKDKLLELFPDRSWSAIVQQLNKLGIHRKNKKWTKEELSYLIENYNNIKTIELSKILNRTVPSIVLKANSLKLDKHPDVYKTSNCKILLNKSLTSFYWIGFILADGHISDNRLNVSLKSSDSDHLQKLANYIHIKLHNNIPYGKNTFNIKGERCYISVKDIIHLKKLVDTYQILSNKTKNPPDIKLYGLSNNQMISLIIGFLDGDGSIVKLNRKNSPFNIRLKNHSSWLHNLEYFKNVLCEYFDVNSKMKCYLNKCGYAQLSISDSRIVCGLKKFIEQNQIPAMERKWGNVPNEIKLQRNKLSMSQIDEILHEYNNSTKINKSKFARDFDVSISAITSVLN